MAGGSINDAKVAKAAGASRGYDSWLWSAGY